MTTKKQPLAEIAARIDAHLKRFEKNPVINPPRTTAAPRPYFLAKAIANGAWVRVNYASPVPTSLTRDEALTYLAWLDAGNVGKHREAGVDPSARRRERIRARWAVLDAAEEARAAAVVFEPVTDAEAGSFVEHSRAGSDVWRLAKTLLMHLRRAS